MRYIPKLQIGDQLKLLNQVSKSPADFIQRLKEKNRKSISDWSNPSYIATHKMSWATDDKGAVVYPNVQNINGTLTDFTRPPYHKWAGLDSAIEKRDTLRTTPKMADWFTNNYKKFFKFKSGGIIPKAQIGRTLAYNWANPTNRQVNQVNKRVYNAVDPTQAGITIPGAIAGGLAVIGGANFRNKTQYPVEESAWKKRLNLPYNKKYLIDNPDGSVRVPSNISNEIVTDTNFVKDRISMQKVAQQHFISAGGYGSSVLDKLIRVDEAHLDSLRKFYSTGEPVGINEIGAWKNRDIIDWDTGKLKPNVVSPLNVFQNFTLYNDPKWGKSYKDVYDFNNWDWAIPGNPFEIKGPLK